MTNEDIADGNTSTVVVYGVVSDISTTSYIPNEIMYLSDTTPGDMSYIPPDILSSVGYALTSETSGSFMVNINNLINIPIIYGFLQGQTTGSYALISGTPTIIANYANTNSLVVEVNAVAGSIKPLNSGIFIMNFTFSGATDVERQSIDIELYDQTSSTALYTYTLPTGRDLDNGKIAISFQVPGNIIDSAADLVIRFISDANMNLTITQCNFSINSLHIR